MFLGIPLVLACGMLFARSLQFNSAFWYWMTLAFFLCPVPIGLYLTLCSRSVAIDPGNRCVSVSVFLFGKRLYRRRVHFSELRSITVRVRGYTDSDARDCLVGLLGASGRVIWVSYFWLPDAPATGLTSEVRNCISKIAAMTSLPTPENE